MASPLNMPEAFVQHFLESAQNLAQAFSGSYAPLSDGEAPAPAQSSPLPGLQGRYVQQQMALWLGMMANATSRGFESAATPGDRRFQAEEWRDNPWFALLKENYLLNANLLEDMVEAAELEDQAKQKLRFYARQFIDSMSPTNFAATNPEAIRLAIDTRGESIKAGLANLLEDLQRGRISTTDETAFEVGKNIAVSAGAVVFENPLFQLIQYSPLTDLVGQRPLLIVPPCINKFYILDLQPTNSFVRYAIEHGLTVFLVSWRNPDVDMGQTTWDDYVEQGAIRAIEVALSISGADKVNTLGWCVGGTILSSALAVLSAREIESVASLTLLTTMLDFHDTGDLGVFIDDHTVAQREKAIGTDGIYPAAELGFVFQTLRANDLIWPNVVNSYLKGKSPEAFDLLFWNADGTNLPGPMYCWYLRNMYLENNLCVPNRLSICGLPVDLGRIDMPSYVLATQEDHIVPWRSAFSTTRLVGGSSQFVLGASGHIAGVINPVSKNKRSYWIDGTPGADADEWLTSAKEQPGSWWSHWLVWLQPHVGLQVLPRTQLGDAQHPPIEPAPGRYVKARAA